MDLREHYEGAVCVVTGATSGNGEALAKELLRLGAEVHALGRNDSKLLALADMGATAHRVDLSIHGDVSSVLDRLPRRVDYFFHLAGNAVLGEVTDEEYRQFSESDFYGPTQLIANLAPRMYPGGRIGIVTSMAAALGDVGEIYAYQKIKRDLIDWWWRNQKWAQNFKISMTLISMGAIDTGIWGRSRGMPYVTKTLVKLAIPGPDRYVKQILADVALGKLVSYPGVGSHFAPVVNGDYHMAPLAKKMISECAKMWFRLFPVKKEN